MKSPKAQGDPQLGIGWHDRRSIGAKYRRFDAPSPQARAQGIFNIGQGIFNIGQGYGRARTAQKVPATPTHTLVQYYLFLIKKNKKEGADACWWVRKEG